MSFTPKSINDINDDFIKDMQKKYSISDEKDKNEKTQNKNPSSLQKAPVKQKEDKKILTPFDAVRPVVVIDQNNKARVVKLGDLENESKQVKEKVLPENETVKTEVKRENDSPKKQTQNNDIIKKSITQKVDTENHKKQTAENKTVQNKVTCETNKNDEKAKSPIKKEKVQEKDNSVKYNPIPKEEPKKKEQTVYKKKVTEENTKSAVQNEQQNDTYNDYLEEFLGILSDSEKRENKNIIKKNVHKEPAKKVKEDVKTDEQFSKKLDEKINEQYDEENDSSIDEKEEKFDYDDYFLANSHAAFAKEQRLRRFFILGSVFLITSILSIAILFAMSRFIPAKEIVEQSKKNEEIVEVNGEGNPHYSNETRIECSFVESYSFSAFINTYYLHWAVVLSMLLMGASIVCFSIYVRERGPGKILSYITSKKKKEE